MPHEPSRRSRYRLGSFLILLCFACLPVTQARAANPCAPPAFNAAPVIRFLAGSSPTSIATADFNRDGRVDLAVPVQGGFGLILGAGDGTFLTAKFVPARDSTFPVFSSVEDVVTGDFNGDGKPDIAVSWNADEISVMLGNGDGTFGAPARLVGGGTGPTFLNAADLNADGRTDLILSNGNTQDVSIFLGKGDGTFGAPTRFPATYNADATAVGDFNGDGKPDLAVAGSQLAILLGDGAGGFGAPTRYDTAYAGYTVATADFNGDGKLDVVVGHVFFNQISVLFGTGTGTFTNRLDIDAGKDARFVSTGDFNRDGKADILVANRESDDVSIYLGDGAGHFAEPLRFVAGYGPIDVAAADFNGDGETDLATVNIFGSSISVMLGKGGGAFAASRSLSGPSTSGPYMTVAGDFNSDGKPDLAVSDSPTKTISVMPGDGGGRFGARIQSGTTQSPFFIAPGHFDGDGKLDLAVLSSGDNSKFVSVLLANGDGTFRQQTSVSAGQFVPRLVVADFNNDGKNDVAFPTGNNPVKTAVMLGDGAGGLSAPVVSDIDTGSQDLIAADLNGDGKMDLAAPNYFAGNVSILLGNGAGGFTSAPPIPVGGQPVSVTAGDFNADGKQDLAALNSTLGGVVVLIGVGNGNFQERARLNYGLQPVFVRVGDFNNDGASDLVVTEGRDDTVSIYQGDGAGNFAGPFSFYAGAGPVWISAADFNGDGKQDIVATGVTIVPLLNTLGTGTPTVQLCPSDYSVGEGVRNFQVLVSRGGDTSGAAAVSYTTQNNTATDTGDYSAAVGTLRFAPGEVSKSFSVFINDDAYAEPVESFFVKLTDATGAKLGQPASLTVSITDNETTPGPNPVSPEGFNPLYFVRQHYVDFLNREPDGPGLAFWTGELNSCGADAQCAEVKRVNVSAAFFLSIEFQETGYLAYRTYKAAYGDATSPNVPGTVPVIRLREFLADTQQLGQGVVVGAPNWEQKLAANKGDYAFEFVQRPRFLAEYPLSMDADNYLRKLAGNAGVTLTGTDFANTHSAFVTLTEVQARAAVLRMIAEKEELRQRELNRAFVLMEYFGYLRRNPDDAPDADFRGWKFWLDKLEQFNGNYVQAEMVKAFLSSDEYRHRFGQ